MLYLNIMMGRIKLQTEAVRMHNTLSGGVATPHYPQTPTKGHDLIEDKR